MPTILRQGPYRFYFYVNDRGQPPHVHVERDNRVAKFWLESLEPHRDGGLQPREMRRVRRMLVERRAALLEAWHERFDD